MGTLEREFPTGEDGPVHFEFPTSLTVLDSVLVVSQPLSGQLLVFSWTGEEKVSWGRNGPYGDRFLGVGEVGVCGDSPFDR